VKSAKKLITPTITTKRSAGDQRLTLPEIPDSLATTDGLAWLFRVGP